MVSNVDCVARRMEWNTFCLALNARQRIKYFGNGYPQPKEFEVRHPVYGNDGASLGVGTKERANSQNIPLGRSRSASERALKYIR
jgi:hypothetical protein